MKQHKENWAKNRGYLGRNIWIHIYSYSALEVCVSLFWSINAPETGGNIILCFHPFTNTSSFSLSSFVWGTWRPPPSSPSFLPLLWGHPEGQPESPPLTSSTNHSEPAGTPLYPSTTPPPPSIPCDESDGPLLVPQPPIKQTPSPLQFTALRQQSGVFDISSGPVFLFSPQIIREAQSVEDQVVIEAEVGVQKKADWWGLCWVFFSQFMCSVDLFTWFLFDICSNFWQKMRKWKKLPGGLNSN